MVRGTLNGGHTALTSETFAESWTLDSTGNWRGFKQDDNGDGTWSLIQSRTANPVNEITDIAESVGPSWVTPAYNRAGNMTTMPQPADPTASYTATYDAWNRLVKIADGVDNVSEYAYDGAKRRIVQKSYDDGVLDDTRHLYYSEPAMWQVIEERVGTSPDSANTERQFVWGERYIDDLVVRDRDTDSNGSLDERLYACQDANWNVTAIVDTTEAVQERYAYSAYGTPQFLTASFITLLSFSTFDMLYGGYVYDVNTRLYIIRLRVYHSQLGEWLRRDPLFSAYHINLYRYAQSSPVWWLDYSGGVCFPCLWVFGCAPKPCLGGGTPPTPPPPKPATPPPGWTKDRGKCNGPGDPWAQTKCNDKNEVETLICDSAKDRNRKLSACALGCLANKEEFAAAILKCRVKNPCKDGGLDISQECRDAIDCASFGNVLDCMKSCAKQDQGRDREWDTDNRLIDEIDRNIKNCRAKVGLKQPEEAC